MAEHTTVIFNPASAGGKTAGQLLKITEVIKSGICANPQIYITRRPGEATDLTRQALKDETSRLIAVGGDGTIQEVVNGYFDHDALIGRICPLGIINCGTGSGLAQSLGIPNSLSEQLDVIKTGRIKRIDCGKIRYTDHSGHPVIRYFINELQFGIGGAVVRKTGKLKKRIGGKSAFCLTTLSAIFSHPNQRLHLEFNGRKYFDAHFTGIVVANGAFTAGGMNLAPGSKVDDGLFNILLIHGQPAISRLIAFSKIYSGDHIRNGKFTYFPAKKLTVTSKEKVLFEADGELLGDLPCSVEIVTGGDSCTGVKTEGGGSHEKTLKI